MSGYAPLHAWFIVCLHVNTLWVQCMAPYIEWDVPTLNEFSHCMNCADVHVIMHAGQTHAPMHTLYIVYWKNPITCPVFYTHVRLLSS